jgi:hypothetical protein
LKKLVSHFEIIKYARAYKEIDFIKYAVVQREENYWDAIQKDVLLDLEKQEYSELAKQIYRILPISRLLANLNDSLAISHFLKIPVTIDSTYSKRLVLKYFFLLLTKYQSLTVLTSC